MQSEDEGIRVLATRQSALQDRLDDLRQKSLRDIDDSEREILDMFGSYFSQVREYLNGSCEPEIRSNLEITESRLHEVVMLNERLDAIKSTIAEIQGTTRTDGNAEAKSVAAYDAATPLRQGSGKASHRGLKADEAKNLGNK